MLTMVHAFYLYLEAPGLALGSLFFDPYLLALWGCGFVPQWVPPWVGWKCFGLLAALSG